MDRARFFALLAISACADLSGLNVLDVGDGGDGAAKDASVTEASDDVAIPADVQPPQPDASTQTFCQMAALSAWCADFDEGDVMSGYANGKKAQWTSSSQSKPTLATVFVSSPASARFDGSLNQSLTFSGTPTLIQPYELFGQLHVEAMTDGVNRVATVQMSSSYGIQIQTTVSGNTAVAISIVEVGLTSDAGVQLTSHPLPSSYKLGSWVSFDVTISAQQVTATVGGTDAVTFNRSVSGGSQTVATTVLFDHAGWVGQWDDVRIVM